MVHLQCAIFPFTHEWYRFENKRLFNATGYRAFSPYPRLSREDDASRIGSRIEFEGIKDDPHAMRNRTQLLLLFRE